MYSLDVKNKITLGGPVVSRHNKTKKYYPNNGPQTAPLDFVCHRYQLAPYGYLELEPKSNSPIATSSDLPPGKYSIHKDSLGRDRVKTHHSGHLHVFVRYVTPFLPYYVRFVLHPYALSFNLRPLTIIRPSKPLSKLSISHHTQDLERIWSASCAPAAVLLVVDRATDFSWDSVFNFFVYGRLWYQRNLEVLVVTAFGADHSAFNFIERAWGAVTKMVAGLKLSNILPGESLCPQCSNLSSEVEHQVCLTYSLFY